MKKLITRILLVLLIVGSFKIVVVEPDQPHTFEVTIPAFTDIVEFFDKVGEAAGEVTKDFEVVAKDNTVQPDETD